MRERARAADPGAWIATSANESLQLTGRNQAAVCDRAVHDRKVDVTSPPHNRRLCNLPPMCGLRSGSHINELQRYKKPNLDLVLHTARVNRHTIAPFWYLSLTMRQLKQEFGMNNSTRALLVSLCMAGSGVILPTLAPAAVGIDIDIAPPAPRVEVVPGPRPGFAWAPGYWDYRGREHVWVPGRYVRERHGMHWVPDRWEQRGPRWHREPGHWER
jgi:hypothetical protein